MSQKNIKETGKRDKIQANIQCQYTEEELINIDCKRVEKECFKYAIAQVNTVSIPDVMNRKAKIEE